MRRRVSSWSGALAGALVLAGCATLQHGTVAATYPGGVARVYLGSSDGVKPGTHVAFYEERCPEENPSFYPYGYLCNERRVGEGMVTQVLNEHEALVQTGEGVRLREGALVRTAGAAAGRIAH
jgi:hypothetical protein